MSTETRSPAKRIYKVTFLSQGQTYEIYAARVSQGELFGFVLIEELLFGEKTQAVIDPSEESLKREFSGVHRFHVPLHAVVRIDEVDKQGAARITERKKDGSVVTVFPTPVYTPGGDRSKS